MLERVGSRRMMIGAVAVAGTTALLPFVFRGDGRAADADTVAVVPGRISPFRDDPGELERWAALVGRPVRVAGSVGVIEAIERESVRGTLPAGVRRHPFTVRFALDPATAPAGDAIVDVDTAIDGLTRLFLQRAAGTADRATLIALFS